MSSDPWSRFAQQSVPPPPAELDQRVHARVNHHLLAQQLAEFALRAMPRAVADMVPSLGGLLRLTLTGKFDPPGPEEQKEAQ